MDVLKNLNVHQQILMILFTLILAFIVIGMVNHLTIKKLEQDTDTYIGNLFIDSKIEKIVFKR